MFRQRDRNDSFWEKEGELEEARLKGEKGGGFVRRSMHSGLKLYKIDAFKS